MSQIIHKIVDEQIATETIAEKQISAILYNVTGQLYTFAVASMMRWGAGGKISHINDRNPNGFYQIMPHKTDDEFFNWYCWKREDYQFFQTKEAAALHFIYYWTQWSGLGKPKLFK